MAKEIIQSDNAPAAIGPYAQGVRVGDQVWFSGQIPLDPVSGEVVSGGIAEQTEQVMKNMGAVLAAAGLDFGQVVKTTIYLVDLADFTVVNEIYGRFFPAAPPARATVEVAALPKGVSVEIEWIAHDDA
ncbi:reactive intermediate/imine deaminase [Geothermobacter hydrogeniphilus]|uniref:Reactive intermediate/imine deaminase n=1 Tax=Geothermobacter hydrogeniphilus TaxID=1969733 RepID=A0A2K2HCA0_9BACT|nr:RidA family protein [Geothermobacter hydrogeniphilus]PNU20942.1 reactive intermediate/imine deaminase [Geothermobacter hydrogeniphilus]